jgi:hypothetical protein
MQAVASPPWVQLANPDGGYALPVPVGAVTALAEDPVTLDRGLGAAEVPAAGARVDLDLTIQTTGPALVAVDPADGATGVPPGIEPLLTFSEAVDPATLPGGVQLFERVRADYATHANIQNSRCAFDSPCDTRRVRLLNQAANLDVSHSSGEPRDALGTTIEGMTPQDVFKAELLVAQGHAYSGR